jgi:hypothetical protein
MKKLSNDLTNFICLSNRVTELQARLIRGKWKMHTKCCSGNFNGRGYLGYTDVDRKNNFGIKTDLCKTRRVRRV